MTPRILLQRVPCNPTEQWMSQDCAAHALGEPLTLLSGEPCRPLLGVQGIRQDRRRMEHGEDLPGDGILGRRGWVSCI